MVQQLKTSFTIKNKLIQLYNNENQLRFMFGELSSDCVNTFTKKTLIQGEFQHSQVKRKVLMLCLNFVELAQVKYNVLGKYQKSILCYPKFQFVIANFLVRFLNTFR